MGVELYYMLYNVYFFYKKGLNYKEYKGYLINPYISKTNPKSLKKAS
jgi:hypothetical protein